MMKHSLSMEMQQYNCDVSQIIIWFIFFVTGLKPLPSYEIAIAGKNCLMLGNVLWLFIQTYTLRLNCARSKINSLMHFIWKHSLNKWFSTWGSGVHGKITRWTWIAVEFSCVAIKENALRLKTPRRFCLILRCCDATREIHGFTS